MIISIGPMLEAKAIGLVENGDKKVGIPKKS